MNKKVYYAIGGGVGIVIFVLLYSATNSNIASSEISELNFTYESANSNLMKNLELQSIQMSNPIKLSDPDSIEKFCSFFTYEAIQRIVEYCTSIELLDSDGNFLGNIHMVGSPTAPKFVMILIQVNPFMHQLDSVKTVFETVIETLVCNCWEDIKPSGIESISQWIDEHREFHSSALRTHSKSNAHLEGKDLQIELTTNTEGYLWKLFITN
jgi:hypothetical protein